MAISFTKSVLHTGNQYDVAGIIIILRKEDGRWNEEIPEKKGSWEQTAVGRTCSEKRPTERAWKTEEDG